MNKKIQESQSILRDHIGYLLQQIDDVGQSKLNILAARDNERNLKERARKERDELFESISVLKQQMIEQRNYTARLKEKIEIKDKALEFYADYDKVLINLDCGKRARAALKGEDTNE